MTQQKFHSPEFEFEGITIPKFNLDFGELIRLCIPNFDSKGNSLVHSFRFGLLNHFEKTIPKAKWSKAYSESTFRKYLKPLTLENHISQTLNIDKIKSKEIAEYLELPPKEKVNNLTLGKRKALAITCDFKKNDTLIFDYFGVGAKESEYLEKIVNSEIKKGKRGITIDRLEFNQNDEINKNIRRIKVSLDSPV